MLNRLALPMAASLFCALAASVQAQTTVGELLDAGGAKLTKDQLVSAMAGTKLTGVSSSGRIEMDIDLKADGTLSGTVKSRQGAGSSSTFGKWFVEENGRACVDERLSAWNMQHKQCWFSYRVGSQSYRTLGDSDDRNTGLVKSDVKIQQN